MQEKFLTWLEVLSAVDAAKDVIITLERSMPWLQEYERFAFVS